MTKWTEQQMQSALDAYAEGQKRKKKLSIRSISRMYKISDTTAAISERPNGRVKERPCWSPIPLGNIKPRHILQLKRQGIDLHEYRSFSITQRRLNSISPAKRMQDPMYIDLKPKRLLTHDEYMAARRLKQNELDDQKREKEEKRKAAALKREAKLKEKGAKRIEKLVKSRLRALETERKKIKVQAKKADKEQQKRKAQVSKKVTASAEKQNAATARPTKAKSKKIATLNQLINFNLSHMVTTSEGQNSSTTYPTDEPLLPTDRQRPHLVTNAVPESFFMNPAATQQIVYFADL